MRRVLLAVCALSLSAQLTPARATTMSFSRTISAPTTFGSTRGFLIFPEPVTNPTEPSTWRKRDVAHQGARCGYIKQEIQHVLPAGSAQDDTTGRLGYVFALPPEFGADDLFSLQADPANPRFDFDVIFYTNLGSCIPGIVIAECQSPPPIVLPGEGHGYPPSPPPNEYARTERICGIVVNRPRSAFTLIGDDSDVVQFDANYAVVVMPVGANGTFTLTLDY